LGSAGRFGLSGLQSHQSGRPGRQEGQEKEVHNICRVKIFTARLHKILGEDKKWVQMQASS
jgi:hypothetical protein